MMINFTEGIGNGTIIQSVRTNNSILKNVKMFYNSLADTVLVANEFNQPISGMTDLPFKYITEITFENVTYKRSKPVK